MARLIVVVLVGCLMVAGCGGQTIQAPGHPKNEPDATKVPAEKKQEPRKTETQKPTPENTGVPDYDIMGEPACPGDGLKAKCLTVATGAKSEKDFIAIVGDLREKNPGLDLLQVEFYPDKPQAESSGLGYAFRNADIEKMVMPNASKAAMAETKRQHGIFAISVSDITKSAKSYEKKHHMEETTN